MEENNVLLIVQDIFTLSPLVFASLLALLIVTKSYKRNIGLTLYLLFNALWTSVMLYGYIELALWILSAVSSIVTFLFIFRGGRRGNKSAFWGC